MSTSTTAPITIYGASDDLLEIRGAVIEEFAAYDPTRVRLVAPDGQQLDVLAEYSRPGSDLEWSLSVEALNACPSWPITFHAHPTYAGEAAVTIDAPVGTTVEVIAT